MSKYRPSNGTEGEWFISEWCGNCQRDEHQDCPIVAATFCYEVDDPQYPAEWIEDDNGPQCTAFIEAGQPLPTPRCASTSDMFEGESP